MSDIICSECTWTNGNLINLGEPNFPRMICQGCAKRAIDRRDKLEDEVTILKKDREGWKKEAYSADEALVELKQKLKDAVDCLNTVYDMADYEADMWEDILTPINAYRKKYHE
jgi:hypothetical protein